MQSIHSYYHTILNICTGIFCTVPCKAFTYRYNSGKLLQWQVHIYICTYKHSQIIKDHLKIKRIKGLWSDCLLNSYSVWRLPTDIARMAGSMYEYVHMYFGFTRYIKPCSYIRIIRLHRKKNDISFLQYVNHCSYYSFWTASVTSLSLAIGHTLPRTGSFSVIIWWWHFAFLRDYWKQAPSYTAGRIFIPSWCYDLRHSAVSNC